MGKATGFLEIQREKPPSRPIAERIRDWREVPQPYEESALRGQTARCMDCGIPFCHQGCPLGNLIPDWNDLVYRDRWRAAIDRLHATNNFPEFTGRLCPAPCEGSCVLGINQAPVTIKSAEAAIIERAFSQGWIVAQPPPARTGKRVAVVGSGPAGLATADQLNRAGQSVTVFERADRIGGLLRYGIPEFKLEKRWLDRRLALMRQEGVTFQTRCHIGVNKDAGDLTREFNAIVLAGGSTVPRDLRQLELLQRPPDTRAHQNPWPTWPNIFRVSSAHEEGGERHYAMATERFSGTAGGRVARLHATNVDTREPIEFDADLVLLAMGFVGPERNGLLDALGVALTARGTVARDANWMTNVPGVFATGDMQRGQSLIVWAIADGRSCARGVDAYLMGSSSLPAPVA